VIETLRDDPAVIPEAVQNSPEFLERWKRLVVESKQLYADMCDSKDVSMMDARMILPKAMTSFYLMRLNLKDLLGFIAQRQDMQIQPAADNLLAVYMAREVLKVLPEASTRISFKKPDMHYVKTFRVPDGKGGWTSEVQIYIGQNQRMICLNIILMIQYINQGVKILTAQLIRVVIQYLHSCGIMH
jgi:thymidylate synthase ThyX